MKRQQDTFRTRSQDDISGVFVLAMAAGPLLLPAIGLKLGDVAFAPSLVFACWAASRCWSAATRVPERRVAWIAASVGLALGALASAVAIASAITGLLPDAGLYVGFAASVALLGAAAAFARGSLHGLRGEQIFDAALAAVLIVALGAWYVAIPGIGHGDVLLTAVFIVDVSALLLVAAAAIARLGMRTGATLVGALLALSAGDGAAVLSSAGRLGDPRVAIALLWAAGAIAFGLGAEADSQRPRVRQLAADKWPWARALFPLPIVIVLACLRFPEIKISDASFVPIAYFGFFTLVALVLGFSRQAYLVVENHRVANRERRVRSEATKRNADLEALTGLAATMTESFEEDAIVERGIEVLRLGAHATSAALHLDDEDGGLELRAVSGPWQGERAFAEAPASTDAAPELEARGGRHVLRLPLSVRDGSIGLVTLVRRDDFEDEDRNLLRLLVGQLGIALQNARDYREKLEQAIRDPLTGIYNRRYFYEAVDKEVQRQRRYGSPSSLVVFDIDDFKAINDRHGHATGDDALRQVAATVDPLIRASDTFARLGGEEFGLLLPETEALDALLVAERVRTSLSRRELLPGVRIRVSAGISSCPADGDTGSVLEKRADQALYWAKSNGKNLCALASEVVLTKGDAARQHAVASLYTLVGMIDVRLASEDHSENVATYATAIGKALGLPPERLVALRRAALLHDIGKLTVGEEVLSKPGPLGSDEFAQIWRHPVVGAKILAHAGLEEEGHWIRHHHERVDGEGYPNGLRGGEIPLESRILFVADALEGMTAERPYRAARTLDGAVTELLANAGSQFDRTVVAALRDLVAAGALELAAGEPAAESV
jgi:diguanylate cyclase (GGDEF)-like protein/putative nucleotidyltransferase with HDIG domain